MASESPNSSSFHRKSLMQAFAMQSSIIDAASPSPSSSFRIDRRSTHSPSESRTSRNNSRSSRSMMGESMMSDADVEDLRREIETKSKRRLQLNQKKQGDRALAVQPRQSWVIEELNREDSLHSAM